LWTIALAAVAGWLCGCGSPVVNSNRTPSPPPSAIPVAGEEIDKATNVRFSTYSKEWPVNWQWIDPDERNPTPHDIKTSVLRIKVPTGKDLYGDNRSAARYVKAIKGDFQIETRVKFLPKENYQGAGLLIFKDDNNYIRFERAYGGLGGGADGVRIDVRKGNEFTPLVTTANSHTEAPEVDLKMVRTGRVFRAYWRVDEENEWREAGEFQSDYADTVLAGVIACNTAREIVAEFAYIRLLPVP